MAGNPIAAAMQITKSAPATLLLLRIMFWLPKGRSEKGGMQWVAKGLKEWGEETSLTPKQLRVAFDILRAEQLIVTSQHLFANRNVLHVRAGITLQSHPVFRGMMKDVQGIYAQAPKGQAEPALQGELLIQEETTGSDNNEKNTAPKIGSVSEDQDMKAFNGKKFSMKDVAEGTAPKKPRLTLKAQKKAKNKLDLGQVWKETMGEVYKGFQQDLTLGEIGQLGNFLKDTDPETAGKVIETCVRHWTDFALKVQPYLDTKGKLPSKPNLLFLVKHRGIAINFTNTFKAPVVAKAQTKKSALPPVEKGTQSEYKGSGDTPAQLEPGDFFGDYDG